MVVKFSPKRSTIACAAGPKLLVNKSITKFNPTNPTPTVNAEIKALLGFVPKIKPKTKIKIGNTTIDPRSTNFCNKSNIMLPLKMVIKRILLFQ